MRDQHTIVITCGKGINGILKDEIEKLGYRHLVVNPYSVEIKGSLNDCMHLNLHLRTATRVLLLIRRFRADNPDSLYHAISKIPWEDYLYDNGYVSVTSFIKNPSIKDTRFGNQKVKDAIVDRIHGQRGRRPDSGPARDGVVIHLHWVNQDCYIYFDTSGETISKHGYRRIPFKAPLRESLAAALVKSTRWQQHQPFINPMGGSGTLAIEAAMMVRNIPPGLNRSNFGFMHLKAFDREQWAVMVDRARENIRPSVSAPIMVNDISLEALRAAKKNAEWAGVEQSIVFDHGDFKNMKIPQPPGIVILNPEYGSRLGEAQKLTKTYGEIGDFFKTHCNGYWGYIFSGNPDLTKKIGLRSSKKSTFYNGKIECRLIEFELYQGSKKND